MANSIDRALDFNSKLLSLRSYRQQVLASNIANADTPGYKAVDVEFSHLLRNAMEPVNMRKTDVQHLDGKAGSPVAGAQLMYRNPLQPSIDGNTVDMDVEQAKFSENALQYMTTLQIMNGKIQSTMLALRGGN